MEDTNESKRPRVATVDDVIEASMAAVGAAGEGRSEPELRTFLSEKLKESAKKAKKEDNDELPDDSFADSNITERLTALELRQNVVEAVVYEISTDLYKNTIRIMPKARIKGDAFKASVGTLTPEVLKDANVIQVKAGFGYIDVIHRDFREPKSKNTKIVITIKRLKLEKTLETVPPYSPEGNILKHTTRCVYGSVLALVEHNKEDVDDVLDKEYKPKTMQPNHEAVTPKFSLKGPDGLNFMYGEIDRKEMRINIQVDEDISFKEVTFKAKDLIDDIRARWSSPYRVRFEVHPRQGQGLPSAPLFRELRREDRRKVGR